MARTKYARRAHISLLWIAGALAGALCGCAVQSEPPDTYVDEDVVEVTSQLDQDELDGVATETGSKDFGPTTDCGEPDPEPWHPRQHDADSPPGPDDDIRADSISKSPGSHDKN